MDSRRRRQGQKARRQELEGSCHSGSWSIAKTAVVAVVDAGDAVATTEVDATLNSNSNTAASDVFKRCCRLIRFRLASRSDPTIASNNQLLDLYFTYIDSIYCNA
jgi:hypothetical protein